VPALAGASDGQTACVVPPNRLGGFLLVHAAAQLVCPNAGELHRVLHAHLGAANDTAAQQALWRFPAEGRLIDLSLLDQLVRLANDGSRRPPRPSLQELARDRAGLVLRDEDELRRAIASAPDPDVALAAEAVCRVTAVVKAFEVLWRQAHAARLAVTGEGQPRFGLLALAVQVRADVALAHAQHGLHLAPGAMLRIVAACESARDRSAAPLLADRDARQWLHLGPDGRAKLRPDGSPRVRRRELRAWLRKVSGSVPGLHETQFAPPPGAGGPSERPEDWGDLLRYHRLLGPWSDVMLATEAGRSCAGAGPSGAGAGYEVLPRLRSRGPDLDALRRLGVAGEFQPAPGHVFLAVRPRDLELRALAAVCRHRLGRSTLADLNAGTLTVSNSTLSSNHADGSGGGIYNAGTATISGCTLSSPSSSLTINVQTRQSANYGGGIYNAGTLTVSSCTFSYNFANDFGGAIYNQGTLTVSNSVFSHNFAGSGSFADNIYGDGYTDGGGNTLD
jgi:predicted outer membrane repeat protein